MKKTLKTPPVRIEDSMAVLKTRLAYLETRNAELVMEATQMHAKVKLLRQTHRTAYANLLEFDDSILPVVSSELSPILNSLAEQNRNR